MKEMELSPNLIEETHHINKKDCPSGTALALSHLSDPPTEIKAHRKEDVFGTHCVHYNLSGEQITLTHTALSRELFASGALKALCFLYEKEKGLYTMDDVFAKENSYVKTC